MTKSSIPIPTISAQAHINELAMWSLADRKTRVVIHGSSNCHRLFGCCAWYLLRRPTIERLDIYGVTIK
jgi:hypothetical protein